MREVFTLMGKKFGILGALAIAVGILGAPYFRNFKSLKIRKNGIAPEIRLALFHEVERRGRKKSKENESCRTEPIMAPDAAIATTLATS